MIRLLMDNEYALIFFLILCMSLSAGCKNTTDITQDPPGASGPITLMIWDLEKSQVTTVEADSISMHGVDNKDMTLHQVKIEMPLENGQMVLTTDKAEVGQNIKDSLIVERTIFLQGKISGRNLKGTAASLTIRDNGSTCTLFTADFIWGQQHVTADRLFLREGEELSGTNWKEKPIAVSGK